jgi:hypothetical protein
MQPIHDHPPPPIRRDAHGHSLPRILLAATTLVLAAAAPLHSQAHHRPLHVDPTLRDCSVIFAPALSQGAFRRFAREFGSVSAFKQAASPATIGRGRLLVGVELMQFRVDEWSDAWHDTFSHPDEHHTLGADKKFPKIKLRYGATDDLDVGAYYASNPNANYGWMGLDARYQLLHRSDRRPYDVAARGAYTRTLYVSDMSMHAITADISVGRALRGAVNAYLGAGADGVIATERSPVVTLDRETLVVGHVFGGVDATFRRRVSVGAEVTVGARPSVQLHLSGLIF